MLLWLLKRATAVLCDTIKFRMNCFEAVKVIKGTPNEKFISYFNGLLHADTAKCFFVDDNV